jgi:hypothetical protein
MISLGIETGDEQLLAQHRSNANLDLVAEKIRLIKKAGIRVKGLMMMGLPGETEQSVKKAWDMSSLFRLTISMCQSLLPFPARCFTGTYRNSGLLMKTGKRWTVCISSLYPRG